MLLDESVNNVDESINIDQNSESEEEEVEDNMLDAIEQDSIQNRHSLLQAQVKNMHVNHGPPSRTSDLNRGMGMGQMSMPNAMSSKDDKNPFKPKKKGFASTLSSAFKNFF